MTDLSRWGSANRGVLMAAARFAGLYEQQTGNLGYQKTGKLGIYKSGVLALSK